MCKAELGRLGPTKRGQVVLDRPLPFRNNLNDSLAQGLDRSLGPLFAGEYQGPRRRRPRHRREEKAKEEGTTPPLLSYQGLLEPVEKLLPSCLCDSKDRCHAAAVLRLFLDLDPAAFPHGFKLPVDLTHLGRPEEIQ